MGTSKFTGDGMKDVTANPPGVEIPMSGERSGSGPIDMAGDGMKDTGGVNDGTPKPSKGIMDVSEGGPGRVKFAGDV